MDRKLRGRRGEGVARAGGGSGEGRGGGDEGGVIRGDEGVGTHLMFGDQTCFLTFNYF